MRGQLDSSRRPVWAPFAQVLAGLAGVLVFVGALFFGLVILAVLIGLVVLIFAAVSIRMWWLRRKLRQAGGPKAGGVTIIEGEYTVLDERRRR